MSAAKGSDEVWVVVKSLSRSVIAGSPRDSFTAGVVQINRGGVEHCLGQGPRRGTCLRQTPNTSRQRHGS